MEVNGFRAKREAIRILVEIVREYVSIRHVFLDRGFDQVHVFVEFNQLSVDYIVRACPSKSMTDGLSTNAETVVDE